MNLPTSLTLLRIFLVPFLVAVLLAPPFIFGERFDPDPRVAPDGADTGERTVLPGLTLREILGVAIFFLASATDFLDGFLARRRNQVTTLGTLLDPVADKLLTSAAFISLVQIGLAPAWMVVIIVGREFAVSGLRSVAARAGITMGASPWGKAKTISQVVAIPLLILTNAIRRWSLPTQLGTVALWVAMILALVSMADYLRRFGRLFPDLFTPPRDAAP
jgi:CDP-diacylglycerol--glycerol-3-phosphate 3-phosphatidyltransferase